MPQVFAMPVTTCGDHEGQILGKSDGRTEIGYDALGRSRAIERIELRTVRTATDGWKHNTALTEYGTGPYDCRNDSEIKTDDINDRNNRESTKTTPDNRVNQGERPGPANSRFIQFLLFIKATIHQTALHSTHNSRTKGPTHSQDNRQCYDFNTARMVLTNDRQWFPAGNSPVHSP